MAAETAGSLTIEKSIVSSEKKVGAEFTLQIVYVSKEQAKDLTPILGEHLIRWAGNWKMIHLEPHVAVYYANNFQ